MDTIRQCIATYIFVVLLLGLSGGEKNEKDSELELKIDYYEALIKKGVKDAANYKPRIDNSDFLAGVDTTQVNEYGTFDFIIVGAGSSGAVVASRLSENPNWKILTLEAGDEENDLSEIPGLHVLLPNSQKNWGYTTTKQKNGCLGMIGEKCPYARGKSVGGSGAINGIMYIRGHKNDYDKWEELGNQGWSFQNISYYFKKSENSQIPDGEEGYHGFAGPINNCYTAPESPLVKAFIDANKELGAEYIDVNGGQSEGVGKCQSSALFGRRVSAGSSYLKNALNRINLNLTTKALVTKILINDVCKKAQGVLFVRNGITYKASASKEVIISGGAINTPQLLMLSGIGPKEELEKHEINVIQDAPVGKTMRDHIAFNTVFFRTNYTENMVTLRNQIKDYLNGFGALTTSFSTKVLSFKNFGKSRIEYILIPPNGRGKRVGAPRNFNKEVVESLKSFDGTSDFLISTILLNPKSQGRITLKSSDPNDFPEIDIGIFSAEEDLEVLYEAVRFAQTLGDTKAFQKFKAKQYFKFKPCEQFEYNSKSFWQCAIKHLSFNGYHMSSTARMGPKDDPMAVVDNELRVYGVKNLRVMDCSIMPDTISGHTNAIAFAIGEKGADMIKNHYRFFQSKYYGQFDFIIVGAGTAGCVLINRLSEIQDWKILGIEAGAEEDDLSEIPGLHTLTSNFRKNWGYITTPQKNGCLGMEDRQCMVTRGFSIGGSSAAGALLYSKGFKNDYESWAKAGNPKWSYDNISKYFKKIENYHMHRKPQYDGFAGPINIEYSEPKSSLHQAIKDGMRELGYNTIDYNSETINGIERIHYNTCRGKRVSSGNTYLLEAKKRLNTNITTEALVTKILISSGKKAYGVQFVKNHKLYQATVRKEVILAGGAINTPQLLMLSGVGPKKMIKKHKIKFIKDLPVGQTLKDHLGYLSLYIRTNFTQKTPELRELLKQYFNGYGYLTKSLNSEFLGYFSTDPTSDKPNIEYVFAPPVGTRVGLYASKRFNKEMMTSVTKKINIFTDLAVSVTLLHPKSSGQIRLKSGNPIDFPEIDIGIFNNEDDIEKIHKGIRNILRILETEPFRKLNASIYSVPKPCETYQLNSKEFWYCSIKHVAFAAHQLSSTTKMGNENDPEAVVDQDLKVFGVDDLRIADCGVIPVTLSGQLNSVAYMIGEKAADIIKGEHLKPAARKRDFMEL